MAKSSFSISRSANGKTKSTFIQCTIQENGPYTIYKGINKKTEKRKISHGQVGYLDHRDGGYLGLFVGPGIALVEASGREGVNDQNQSGIKGNFLLQGLDIFFESGCADKHTYFLMSLCL